MKLTVWRARLELCTRIMIVMSLSCIATASIASAQEHKKFEGIWRVEKPVFAVLTVDGKEPPLKPQAEKTYREHIAARRRGDTSFDGATWCASVGVPRILFIDYPFQIMLGAKHVAFMHEWNWWARVVYLDGALTGLNSNVPQGQRSSVPSTGAPPAFGPPQPSADLPGSMGLSQGKWQGDTLVVETTHLIDSTLLDSAGLPHSDDLKLTERWRLQGPDVLENRIRIDDPAIFSQPWETVVIYRRQLNTIIKEDVCLDRIKMGAPALQE